MPDFDGRADRDEALGAEARTTEGFSKADRRRAPSSSPEKAGPLPSGRFHGPASGSNLKPDRLLQADH